MMSEDHHQKQLGPYTVRVNEQGLLYDVHTGKTLTAKDINEPPSPYVFTNIHSGLKHHFRAYVPDNPTALVFFFHGYASHVSSPSACAYASWLMNHGYAVFMMDRMGHGLSQGERVLISNASELIDDEMAFVLTVLDASDNSETDPLSDSRQDITINSNSTVDSGPTSFAPTKHEIPVYLKGTINSSFWKDFLHFQHSLKTLPFFFTGQSMGGTMALHISLRIRKMQSYFTHRFRGTVVSCPAIIPHLPHPIITFILRNLVAPLVPNAGLPQVFDRVSDPDLIWINDVDKARVAIDAWGNEGGLGWGRSIKFATAVSLIDLSEALYDSLHDIDFPFAVLHDINDGIVSFRGSEELMQKSSTPSDQKTLHSSDNLRHDLLSNSLSYVCGITHDFIQKKLYFSTTSS